MLSHCRFQPFCPRTSGALGWDRPGVGQAALYMFLEAIVLFILIILIEVLIIFQLIASVLISLFS